MGLLLQLQLRTATRHGITLAARVEVREPEDWGRGLPPIYD